MLRTPCSSCVGTSTCCASVAPFVAAPADRPRRYNSRLTSGRTASGWLKSYQGWPHVAVARPPACHDSTSVRKLPNASRYRGHSDRWKYPRPAARNPRGASAARASGPWATASPSTRTRRTRRTMTGSTSASGSSTSTPSTGFDSIDPADLRGRFRWYGLYTQRRPGIDGGKTAMLEPEELDDRYFMLRIRIDGGQLTSEQLRVDRRHLPATTRAAPPTSPTGRTSSCTGWRSRTSRRSGTPWRRSACPPPKPAVTRPGSILGCPLAGIDADEIIDGDRRRSPRSRERYIGDPALSNLPRKFKSSISGCAAQCTHPRDQRRRVRRRRHPETASSATTCGSAAGCPPTP